MEYLEHDEDAMEVQHILEGPQDEKDIDQWLGVALHPSVYMQGIHAHNQMDGGFYSSNRYGCTTVQTLEDHETEDFLEQSCNSDSSTPKKGWRCGRRRPRKRRISPWNLVCCEKSPSESGRRKYRTRKNNDHWTHKEVNLLVKAIAKYGVGRWTEVKRRYFSQSIRTAVNIKDKWRNLLRASGGTITSNKKRRLELQLIERIRRLAAKYPYAKHRTVI